MVRAEGIAKERIDSAVIIDDMVQRVVVRLRDERLDLLLNEMCFSEEKRLRKKKDKKSQYELEALRTIRKRLGRADNDELQDMLAQMARSYTQEIHGHFDAGTYEKVTQAIPKGLSLLLSREKAWKRLSLSFSGSENTVAQKVRCSGAVDHFNRLVELGTCILVPTHVSNMDSPVVGFVLHQAQLPPLIYGAGINLFDNWLLSWFMDHLGAYKVDREKNHDLYKEVLKEYATMALERRWHSLFFPGGTRIRSGKVESKLKKGLMGTGLDAYRRNLAAGRDKPRIFFIPATINYPLVLEAETLIEDHLQEAGKSRYVITDDEFSRPDRVLQFVNHLSSLRHAVDVVISTPLDPFGNPVDENGASLDPDGRPFDPAGYLMHNGKLVEDEQRDRAYTERLADAVCTAYRRDTILFDTHILAAAVHRRMQAAHPDLDLFQRLLLPVEQRRIPVPEADAEIELLLEHLRALSAQGQARLGPDLERATANQVRRAGMAQWGGYHQSHAVLDELDHLLVQDPRLALYYASRLDGLPIPPPRKIQGFRS